VAQSEEQRLPAALVEASVALDVREEVLDVLLEKIEGDRFPSATMMDDVERLLPPWRRQEYTEILLDMIRADRFPSRSLIQRVVRLSG
jgi:hypothetical protein